MKKALFILVLFTLISTVFVGCKEEKTAGEKIEKGLDDIGDGIGDAAEHLVDEVKGAVD